MDPNNFQTLTEALLNRLERQEMQVTTTSEVLVKLVSEVRNLRQDGQQFQQQQSRFNQLPLDGTDRQETFNERQDQSNIIFLDEIRDIKLDVRELKKDIAVLKDVTLKQYDDRLKKLEDFMDNFMRKAG